MVKTHSLEVHLDLQIDLKLKIFPEPQNKIEMYIKNHELNSWSLVPPIAVNLHGYLLAT